MEELLKRIIEKEKTKLEYWRTKELVSKEKGFLEIEVDGKPIKTWDACVAGKRIEIIPYNLAKIHEVFDEQISSEVINEVSRRLHEGKEKIKEPIRICIFSGSIGSKFSSIEKEIDFFNDKMVDMGEISSFVVFGASQITGLKLKKRHFYHIFTFSGQTFLGMRSVATLKYPATFAYNAHEMTLEESKFLVLHDIGITPKEAEGVKAKVIPIDRIEFNALFPWMMFVSLGFEEKIGEYAGFCFDPESKKLPHRLDEFNFSYSAGKWEDHTAIADRDDGVCYSHDFLKEEFLSFFRKETPLISRVSS